MFFAPAWVTVPCLFLAGYCAGQDLQLDGKASVVQESGRHVFRVDVATNLPDHALVEGELYYLVQEPSEDRPSVKEWVEKPVLGALSHAPVTSGRAVIDLGRYATPPYPLTYRVKLEYDPAVQDPKVRDAAPVARRVRTGVDFQYGDASQYRQAVEDRKSNYFADYVAIDRSFRELKQTFMDVWKDPQADPVRWPQWKRPFVSKIEKIKEINGDRMIIMNVSFDWKGEQSIDGMCIELLELVGICNDLLAARKPGKALPAEAQEALRRFQRMYDDGFTSMDFDAQVDLTKALPALEAIRDGLRAVEKTFRSWREGTPVDPAAWEREKTALQIHLMDQLMILSSELPKSSMAKRVTDLSGDLSALFAHCDLAFAGADRSGAEDLSVLIGAVDTHLDDIRRALHSGGQK